MVCEGWRLVAHVVIRDKHEVACWVGEGLITFVDCKHGPTAGS